MQLFIYSCNSCFHLAVIKEQPTTTDLTVPINPLIHLLLGAAGQPEELGKRTPSTFCSHRRKEEGEEAAEIPAPA